MKTKTGLLFGLIIVMLGWANYVAATYKQISLDGDWDFTFKQNLSIDTPDLPNANTYDIKLKVPDYMNFQTERLSKAKWANSKWQDINFINLQGTAFYRKMVDIPANWAEKSVQLYIGRAYDRINVWINGEHIVFNPYISMVPSLIDLSGILKPGTKNEIIISVDNKTKLTYKFATLGGIVSPVYLEVSNGTGRIDSLYLRPGKDLTEIAWQADLKIPFKRKSLNKSSLDWIVKEYKSGKQIAKGSIDIKGFTESIVLNWTSTRNEDIQLWQPNHPNLYIAEVEWKMNGTVIDTLKQRFGLRRWSSVGRNLKLNGKPIYLRQVYRSFERTTHWRYPQDKNYWLKYFKLIKNHGYNAVDWLSIASPEALEAADEAGIVVQCGYLFDARKYLKTSLKVKNGSLEAPFLWVDIAKWTRVHPSMSIYVLGGEMAYYQGFIDDVAKCNEAIKVVNPESLLMPNQAMRGIEYSFASEDKVHVKNGVHPKRLEQITKCSDVFGNFPNGVFSYHPFDGNWQDINQRFVVYQRPLISHEVMQSTRLYSFLQDGKVPTLRYGIQGVENIIDRWSNFPASKAAIKKAIITRLADSKDYLYYKNMSELSAILFKYVGEKMRKCNNVAGYQDIGAHGGMNLFLQNSPGFSAESFRRFNNDNVLLLDWDNGMCLRYCYWANTPFGAIPMVSMFGDEAIQNGKLSWTLKNGEQILLSGTSQVDQASLGKVTNLEAIKFNWPEVEKNSKLNLSVELSGNGQTVKNDWSFWIFKKLQKDKIVAAASHNMYLLLKKSYPELRYLSDKTAKEKLWVVDLLNEKTIQHLEAGGDVLLIGGKPFPLHTRWPKFEQGFRNHHNNGSIVYEHPIWENIPNEGWGDWQFYPLLNGSAPVSFRDDRTAAQASQPMVHPKQQLMKNVPFQPILEIIHRRKQADQASIFELKAGKGRLFVTTCATDMENPACATLMNSILRYISGSEFNPAKSVSPQVLRTFIEGSGPLASGNKIRFSLNNFMYGSLESQYKAFFIAPKNVVFFRSGEKTENSFELTASQIPEAKGKYLILSVEGQDSDKTVFINIEILLNGHQLFKGVNQWVKMGWSTWNIPFPREWLRAGSNKLEFINLEKSGSSQHKWCGISSVIIKADDKYVEERCSGKSVSNDQTPPVMRFVSFPPIDKYGHQYIGTSNTVFEIKAEDKESGVKKIEMSVDNGPYIACDGPFMLGTGGRDLKTVGVRTLRFRCTDHAGNKSNILKGASEEGQDLDKMDLQIKAK